MRRTRVALASAPPIRNSVVFGQRGVLAVLLVAAALAGEHSAALETRLVDAAFAFGEIALVAGALRNTPNRARCSMNASPFVRRDVFCALPAALSILLGARVLRSGFAHAGAATGLREGGSSGYAHANAETTISLAFGGAVGVGLGFSMLTSGEVLRVGTQGATDTLAFCASAQLAAAYGATLATPAQMPELQALFAETACAAPAECKEAFRARRQALAGTLPGALWVSGLATLVAAFGPALRDGPDAAERAARARTRAAAPAIIGVAYCCWRTLAYAPFSGGAHAVAEWSAVCALVAAFAAAIAEPWFGCALFLGASVVDVAVHRAEHGLRAEDVEPSDCFQAIMMALLALHLLLGGLAELLWRARRFTRALGALERAMSALALMGTSNAALLFLLSAGLVSSASGALPRDEHYRVLGGGDKRYARASLDFIFEHFIAVLVWMPAYAQRCEKRLFGRRERALLWFSAAVPPVLLWFALRASAGAHPFDATSTAFADASSLAVASVMGALAWAALAFA